jgi:DNA modification methylase
MGLPDYIITMRKPGINPEPVSHGRGFESYIGDMPEPKKAKTDNARTNKYSHEIWQRYASPVWFDINQTRTLNIQAARSENDEKHICPLQLDTIARCLELWSNKNDTILSPFGGIGSEGYEAIQMDRKYIGIELKKSYFDQMVKNLEMIDNSYKQESLFDL